MILSCESTISATNLPAPAIGPGHVAGPLILWLGWSENTLLLLVQS